MSISILNRGSSGGLKPELTVTAPSGSIIDLLQNEIIVATYTLGLSETEHIFTVKLGTYTVRGTLDKVQNKEVVIDTVGQYAVEIDYKLWLYREGDECVDITGGWEKTISNKVSGTITKNEDSVTIAATNDCAICTQNIIPVTSYQKICISVIGAGSANSNGLLFYINFNKNSTSFSASTLCWEQQVFPADSYPHTYTYDITDWSSEDCYIFINGSQTTFTIDRIWLE